FGSNSLPRAADDVPDVVRSVVALQIQELHSRPFVVLPREAVPVDGTRVLVPSRMGGVRCFLLKLRNQLFKLGDTRLALFRLFVQNTSHRAELSFVRHCYSPLSRIELIRSARLVARSEILPPCRLACAFTLIASNLSSFSSPSSAARRLSLATSARASDSSLRTLSSSAACVASAMFASSAPTALSSSRSTFGAVVGGFLPPPASCRTVQADTPNAAAKSRLLKPSLASSLTIAFRMSFGTLPRRSPISSSQIRCQCSAPCFRSASQACRIAIVSCSYESANASNALRIFTNAVVSIF